ncbi:uncharacterized protein DUF4241 [Stackebrandtia albiflava]|uniref:Uncharacterized protein DUF4241 n=1 Tax=Stackebrandtia albiflava TaxID=406432 RepID=A0A562VAR5_9ACTN|nr:DUF4241 domain-containing protein [Stackebrandtia albiflava]TWJ14972.1 uncharacterized protein DUF4241 [Stackebrandtia albiflava]
MPYHPDLAGLLIPGSEHPDPDAGYHYVVRPHALPDAVLPSGRVAACDPLVSCGDAEPLEFRVPPGRYPLVAWVASTVRDGVEYGHRVTALQMRVHDAPIHHWRLDGDAARTASLGESEFTGFPVDAGCAALSDVVALRALHGWDEEDVEDVFMPEAPEVPGVPGSASAVTDHDTGANVVIVGSGWGDGVYPVFACFDDTERFTGYVIDFMVVPTL